MWQYINVGILNRPAQNPTLYLPTTRKEIPSNNQSRDILRNATVSK
jgi:hypothetical protein